MANILGPHYYPYGPHGPYNPTPFIQMSVWRYPRYPMPFAPLSQAACLRGFVANRRVPSSCCYNYGVACTPLPDQIGDYRLY